MHACARRYETLKAQISDKFRNGAISWYRGKAFQQISLLQIAEHFIMEMGDDDPPIIPGGPLAEKVIEAACRGPSRNAPEDLLFALLSLRGCIICAAHASHWRVCAPCDCALPFR